MEYIKHKQSEKKKGTEFLSLCPPNVVFHYDNNDASWSDEENFVINL